MPNFPVTATDTGLAVTDAIASYHPISLLDEAFPSFAGTPILDNFNRSNESPLSQGGNWWHIGAGTQPMQLVSNAATCASGSNSGQGYQQSVILTDQEAYATISALPDSGGYAGVLVRQSPTGTPGYSSCYTAVYYPGVGVQILWHSSSGGGFPGTVLATYPVTLAAGDGIGLRAVGSTLTAYIRQGSNPWSRLGSVTDSTYTSGTIGLVAWSPTGTVVRLDDFGGGVPAIRPFDAIQPNHYTVALSDDAFLRPFPSTSVLDNFQRANENPLNGGGRWAKSGAFGGNFQLLSHIARLNNLSQYAWTSEVAVGSFADSEVWGTIGQLPSSSFGGGIMGLSLRQNPAANSGKQQYNLQFAGTRVFITYDDASGTQTTLAAFTVPALIVGDSLGLRAVGSTLTAYYKQGAGAWTVAGSVTDTNLTTAGYLGLIGEDASGLGGMSSFGGGPVGLWDSITPLLAPHGLFPDTGLTVTDAIMTARTHSLTDTGMTFTDGMVIFLNGKALVGLTDTGLTLTDAITKFHTTTMADTGLTVSGDAITSHPTRVHLLIDSLALSDSIDKAVTKLVSVTGVTVTDSLARSYPRSITTTGLAVTDSLARGNPHRTISDQGLSFSTAFWFQKNSGGTAYISDIGLVLTESLTKVGSYFRSVPIYAPDTGLTIRDGVRVHTVPPFKPRKPQADFTWTSLLLTANFTDTSTPGSAAIESWDWAFGDGGTSSATNPPHTYSAGGTYNVSLTVTTIYGTSTVTKPVTVDGTAPPGTHIDGVIL